MYLVAGPICTLAGKICSAPFTSDLKPRLLMKASRWSSFIRFLPSRMNLHSLASHIAFFVLLPFSELLAISVTVNPNLLMFIRS